MSHSTSKPLPRRFEPLEMIVLEVDKGGKPLLNQGFSHSSGVYVAMDNATGQLVIVKFKNPDALYPLAIPEGKALELLVGLPQVPALVRDNAQYIAMGMMGGSMLHFPASDALKPEECVLAAAQMLNFAKGVSGKGLHYFDFKSPNTLWEPQTSALSIVDFSNLQPPDSSAATLFGSSYTAKSFLNAIFDKRDYVTFGTTHGNLAEELAGLPSEDAINRLRELVMRLAEAKGVCKSEAKSGLWDRADSLLAQRQEQKKQYLKMLQAAETLQWEYGIDVSQVKSFRGLQFVKSAPSKPDAKPESAAPHTAVSPFGPRNEEPLRDLLDLHLRQVYASAGGNGLYSINDIVKNALERALCQTGKEKETWLAYSNLLSQAAKLGKHGVALPDYVQSMLLLGLPSWYVVGLRDAVHRVVAKWFSPENFIPSFLLEDPSYPPAATQRFHNSITALQCFGMEPEGYVTGLFEQFGANVRKWQDDTRLLVMDSAPMKPFCEASPEEMRQFAGIAQRVAVEGFQISRLHRYAQQQTQHPVLRNVSVQGVLNLVESAVLPTLGHYSKGGITPSVSVN